MNKNNNSHLALENQVAIVTGACSDIGKAIAIDLLSKGASVVLSGTRPEALADLKQELTKQSALIETFLGDLSDENNALEMIRFTIKHFGRLDILINNAGGGVIRPFLEHTPETLRTTVDRNLWTAVWCTWAALPSMKEQQYGRIINLGADSVRNGLWEHAGYNAAKGGVHAMTSGLAREFALDNITINTVAPCAVRTKALEDFLVNDPETAQKFIDVIPQGRAGEPEEIASMVSYLATREASYVTGQVISVNGGSTML